MNPSSIHAPGKFAKQKVQEAIDDIFRVFGLDESFLLFFHSGATEGNNSIIRGWANSLKEPGVMFYSKLDHPSVCNIVNYLTSLGHSAQPIPVDKSGNLLIDELITKIKSFEASPILINYTVVNNETGVHWKLENATRLKAETGAFIHVDASQLVGKIENWNHLLSDLDSYTFSGHKFGALKGTGFSFYKKEVELTPLLQGGGQQEGMRSGTLNVMGIVSLQLALRDVRRYQLSSDSRDFIEKELERVLAQKGEILFKAGSRSLNTIFFGLYDLRAEVVLAAFDLEGLAVSNGSACSSDLSQESRALNHHANGAQRSLAPIRISLPPDFCLKEAQKVANRLKKIIERLTN